MNQVVQYVLIFGVVGVFFAFLYAAVLADVGQRTQSVSESFERYALLAGERIAPIDVYNSSAAGTPSTVVDAINTGAPVVVAEVYVDGVLAAPASYTVANASGALFPAGGEIPTGEIISITVSPPGATVAVVTESGGVFRFG